MMTLEGLVFGGTGTLSECADIDRRAWNTSFHTHGLDWTWSWETYATLMRSGGDRDLVSLYAMHHDKTPDVAAGTLDATHQKIFASMMTQDAPLRPGVARVLNFAARAGIKLGFASRAGKSPVRALLQATARARSGISFDVAVVAEDITRVAPHPEAMERMVEQMAVGRERIAVVADTPATAEAAQHAGLAVIAFPGLLAAADPSDFGNLPIVKVLTPEAVTGAWGNALETAAQ